MTISAALVLFAVIWFMCLFIALPLRIKSQQEDGYVVPGTPPSAPSIPRLRKKVVWVSIITIIIWLILVYIISSGIIRVQDISFFNRSGNQ
ncbi:MAG: hypothetical protein CML58_06980 [Rhodobacteraceae bacterium]|jgi:predicted secreted protein|nr:hypothetical protein [Paracoccaceae bacterium]MBC66113.1 hypothetical protein [Paracoccaceae bacterium]RZO37290.1 MAG: DUF1467 family protein [Paracoccaceae bacterium]|tara:strand:+ start:2481 stop:2753 length:273 start_codon:yes stop_codon:yes gene_type:complete